MQRRKPSGTQEQGTSPTPPAKALQEYIDTEGHFSLVRNFRLADLVTIMNGFCGAFSVFYSAHYLLSDDETHLKLALAFPVGGLLFDFFDGKVARWRNSSSLLGQELDSLADLISFGVAPAVLAFALGLRTVLDMVGLTVFVCCGLARLARFNATVASVPKDDSGKSKYFEGLPIPSSLAIVAAMSYCVSKGYIEGKAGVPGPVYVLGPVGELHGITLVFVGWAAMMVSKTMRIPKL